MNIFSKNIYKDDNDRNMEKPVDTKLENINESKSKKISAAILLQNDLEILEQLNLVISKVDAMDKSNKKFLMTASMKKIEELENRIESMKNEVVKILDNIDLITDTLADDASDNVKKGIEMILKGINKSVTEFEIEEIVVNVGDVFNTDMHKCVDKKYDANLDEDIIVRLVKRGYRDSLTGITIRPAEVVINKQ